MSSTQTNSSLSCARECLRKYELAYELQLERDGEEREVFAVGTAWHLGMEHRDSPHRYNVLRKAAPSPLWGEKLAVLASGHDWFWSGEPLKLLATEFTFAVGIEGRPMRGQIDGVVEAEDGQRGIIEYKTTSDSLDGPLLDKLRLDTQVGLYGLASRSAVLPNGERAFPSGSPDFILYDVVRKPTIAPKALSKADVSRMKKELDRDERCTYFGVAFGEQLPGGANDVLASLAENRECDRLYAARLRADIGERPTHYYARRLVHRTQSDYAALLDDILAQLEALDGLEGKHYPRNPNSCTSFGTCEFFGLCSNNVHPRVTDQPPQGFRRRAHRHPELDGKPSRPE